MHNGGRDEYITNKELREFSEKNQLKRQENLLFELGFSSRKIPTTVISKQRLNKKFKKEKKLHFTKIDKVSKISELKEIKKQISIIKSLITNAWNTLQQEKEGKLDFASQIALNKEFKRLLFFHIGITQNKEYDTLLKLLSDISPEKIYSYSDQWINNYLESAKITHLTDFRQAFIDNMKSLAKPQDKSFEQKSLGLDPRSEKNKKEILNKQKRILFHWKNLQFERAYIEKDYEEALNKRIEMKSLQSDYLTSPADKLFKELILNELGNVFDVSNYMEFFLGDSEKIVKHMNAFIKEFLKNDIIDIRFFHKQFCELMRIYPVLALGLAKEEIYKIPVIPENESNTPPTPTQAPAPRTRFQRFRDFLWRLLSCFRRDPPVIREPVIEQEPQNHRVTFFSSLGRVFKRLGCCRVSMSRNRVEYEPPNRCNAPLFKSNDNHTDEHVNQREFSLRPEG